MIMYFVGFVLLRKSVLPGLSQLIYVSYVGYVFLRAVVK